MVCAAGQLRSGLASAGLAVAGFGWLAFRISGGFRLDLDGFGLVSAGFGLIWLSFSRILIGFRLDFGVISKDFVRFLDLAWIFNVRLLLLGN